ncbi:heterokaryon incompatibility protein-domain-containing protein [Mycena olivaceomarginata]|nr:heterokaryon incompatibility protein-domain-containing protein [Mycena olivaceomarginata]
MVPQPSISAAKNLVCEDCWATVFPLDSFATMRQRPSSGDALWYEGGGFTYETLPWADLQEAAKLCTFCGWICRTIAEHILDTPPPSEKTFSVTVGLHTVENHGELPFEVLMFVVNDGNRIEDCSKHEFCPHPTPASLPTRVIDCSDPDKPHLVTSHSSWTTFYAALSYVWGEDQPNRTTAENIERYHSVIDLHLIPKTIQDAIHVTHSLGLKYLWVDSFCILQDSDDDKGHEIERIRLYFRHAYITIVATSANRVSDGFLYDSAPWNIQPMKLPYPIKGTAGNAVVGTMILYHTHASWPTTRNAVDLRAWCLEERVLSPRRLMFGSHTVYYECQKTCVNLNRSPLGLPDIYPRLPDLDTTADRPDSEAFRISDGEWEYITGAYTERKLTKEKDKMVAIAAVAEQFQEFLPPQSRYVAGLWTHQLPESLLWSLSNDSQPLSPLPQSYRAPSWSWAAINGPVSTIRFLPFQRILYSSRIASCDVTLKRETNPYGEVTSGVLELEAKSMDVLWDPTRGRKDNLFARSDMQQGLRLTKELNPADAIGDLTPDSSEFTDKRQNTAICVVVAAIAEGKTSVFGLALVPGEACSTKNGMLRYCRIGLARVDVRDWISTPLSKFYVI